MIKIKRRGDFTVMLDELLANDESLEPVIYEKIKWFQSNPKDTRLNNHALTKRLEGKWAFNITTDIRIVYEWQGINTVRFLAIGTHSQVYNRRNYMSLGD